MGYTHYFTLNSEYTPTSEEWGRIQEKVNQIFFEHKDILVEEYDLKTPPICNENLIRFNGRKEDGHETFYLSKTEKMAFNFCKTARKPYDLAVFKVLKAVKKICPNWIELGSDAEDGEKAFNLSPEEYIEKELNY